MDAVGLATLRDELAKDCEVSAGAFDLARRRLEEASDAALDSCGHHLARFYNVIEQMALRVAKAFENALDNDKGWHAELIGRMTLRINGVRPAFFPETSEAAFKPLAAKSLSETWIAPRAR
jgi:HepT-like protein